MGRINITNIEANANAVASLWNSRYSIISEVINGNLDAENLASNAVETAKIKDRAVTADKLADDAIGTDTISDASVTLAKLTSDLKNSIHPIGSIFTSSVATNPATLIGFGTWEAFGAGRVLVGKASSGTFVTNGATGGHETIALTSAQSGLVGHNHSQNSHGHSGNAHTHSQNSHNHSQNPHTHGYVAPHNPVLGPALNAWAQSYSFIQSTTGGTTATNNATTATNNSTTATVNNTTASNNAVSAANAVSAHSNLQPYVVVYYWKRVS